VGGSKKSLDGLPEDVKDVFGSALLDVQYGGRQMGRNLHEIWKIVEDYDSIPTARRTRRRFLKLSTSSTRS
jgi:hypothetical protein